MPTGDHDDLAQREPPSGSVALRPPLRVTTCGAVDDGKSTLIGRLLFDTRSVPRDQLEAIERASRARGQSEPDLSLLTDGLRAEREQGITIDVAYRYFGTPRRRFIVADAPGHAQYTRNMATAASVADLAILLVDARNGITHQTRRHALIATLMRVPSVVLAVNKLDAIEDPQAVFERVCSAFAELMPADVRAIAPPDIRARFKTIPISALRGDNVVRRSGATGDGPAPRGSTLGWYTGPTLLELLENAEPRAARAMPLRLQVTAVIRPGDGAIAGTGVQARAYGVFILEGRVSVGQEVVILPSGRRSRVASLGLYERSLTYADAPRAVTLTLEHEIDVARGDFIADADRPPEASSSIEADVVWFDRNPLVSGARLIVKQGARSVRAIVERVAHRHDPNQGAVRLESDAASELAENDVGRVWLKTSAPLVFDVYERSRAMGSFILIDRTSTDTVGGGMILQGGVA
ncbi:MAG: GTP-binding protein [Planctomycetota bacterium]|nr:GTP-binding protein [Planctomycetota bacterium]